MTSHPVFLYDAFTDVAFGGSQAAVVMNASNIPIDDRHRISKELGMPATAFVDKVEDNRVCVQFVSTVMELPMCGHGTVCLVTHLVQHSLVNIENGQGVVTLNLPRGTAETNVTMEYGKPKIMLSVSPSELKQFDGNLKPLTDSLGLSPDLLRADLPVAVARGDFVHLAVPVKGLEAMSAIEPNFPTIVGFCHEHDIETVTVFCRETVNPDRHLHVRDFCPAVGVPESAAAGTTNAALACYLCQYDRLLEGVDTGIEISAEQGLELGRPSKINSRIDKNPGTGHMIAKLQVGGMATQILSGEIVI